MMPTQTKLRKLSESKQSLEYLDNFSSIKFLFVWLPKIDPQLEHNLKMSLLNVVNIKQAPFESMKLKFGDFGYLCMRRNYARLKFVYSEKATNFAKSSL